MLTRGQYREMILNTRLLASLVGIPAAVLLTVSFFNDDLSYSSHFVIGCLAHFTAIGYTATTALMFAGNKLGIRIKYGLAPFLASMYALVSILEIAKAVYR